MQSCQLPSSRNILFSISFQDCDESHKQMAIADEGCPWFAEHLKPHSSRAVVVAECRNQNAEHMYEAAVRFRTEACNMRLRLGIHPRKSTDRPMAARRSNRVMDGSQRELSIPRLPIFLSILRGQSRYCEPGNKELCIVKTILYLAGLRKAGAIESMRNVSSASLNGNLSHSPPLQPS